MSVIEVCLIVVSAVSRLALAAVGGSILHWYGERLNDPQRYGLGLLAGCSLMTVPVVISTYTGGTGTPFDLWAGAMMGVGMLMFLSGTAYRVKRHADANDQQIFAARQHLHERGKL